MNTNITDSMLRSRTTRVGEVGAREPNFEPLIRHAHLRNEGKDG